MNDSDRLRLQAKLETGVAIAAAALFLLTLISREWIEFLTGWDDAILSTVDLCR